MTRASDHPDRRRVLAGGAALMAAGCAKGAAGAPAPELDASAGWRRVADLPYAVQEIYPTAFEGRIHLAGGFVAENGRIVGPTDAHVAYDPAADAWTPRAPLPEARHHPNLVALGDRLYAIGGFQTQSAEAVWVMRREVWTYDAAADAWSDGPATPTPTGECVTAALDGAIHVAGGRRPKGDANASWTDHADTGAHVRLDPASGVWADAAPAPTARNSAAGAVIDGLWHVVGGRVVDGGNLTAHEVYDAREDRWRAAAPMPQGQGGLAAAALGGKLYAFGGEFFGPASGGVYAEAWAYDPARDAWAEIAPMPTPRHGLGAVALGADIFVVGGARLPSGNDTSAIVEAYRPI